MQFNIDKRFIEILNEQGCPITWDKFRAAYDVRKAERDADPVVIARKMRREALARIFHRSPPRCLFYHFDA
ncbi:hypothetical protein [Macromonas nakdongensis]|uniref:hypothetical protein n=1 Tax=Macromonas nakdongensis TaxID=1843082 RepID=UPI0018E39A4E|nr:hypothetical protein [Macromonas nakdongensis]